MKKCFAWFLTLMIVFGCSNSSRFDLTIAQADSIMETNPDSVSKAIKMLDMIKRMCPRMSKEQKMRFELIYAKAMNKGYIDFTSDSIMKEVVAYYDKNGSDNDKMQAHYLLGCVYRDLRDSPNALKCLYESISYAKDDKKSYLMLSKIHSQIAYLLDKQALMSQEIKELDKASHYAMLAGDTIEAITNINLKASAYFLINKQDSAALINNMAIKMFKDKGFIQYAAQISGNCLEYYIQRKDFSRVKERLKFYEQQSGYFNQGEIEKGKEVYYYEKGLYYLGLHLNDSAEAMFRKCLHYSGDSNARVAAYRGLSLLYKSIGNADSTAKYAMVCYDVNDSAYQESLATKMLQMQSIYDYSVHQNAAVKNANRIISLQRWLFTSFVLFILLTLVALYLYKRKKNLAMRKFVLLKEQYEKEMHLLETEKDGLNVLLKKKESLLGAICEQHEREKNEINIEIDNKRRTIIELKERVLKIERDLKIQDVAKTEDEIMKSFVRKDFIYYKTHVTEHPSEKQWNMLSTFAKESLPEIYVMLGDNNVSEKEFRITILTRMRFKPGEIVTIMNCGFSDVSLVRCRLLKKLFGIEGKAADFDKRILRMF